MVLACLIIIGSELSKIRSVPTHVALSGRRTRPDQRSMSVKLLESDVLISVCGVQYHGSRIMLNYFA